MNITQLRQAGTQKYLPPRHKDTKDFILLIFLSVLVTLWREEKSFATKYTKIIFNELTPYLMTQPPLQEKLVTGYTKQTIQGLPPLKEATGYPPIFSQDLYISW